MCNLKWTLLILLKLCRTCLNIGDFETVESSIAYSEITIISAKLSFTCRTLRFGCFLPLTSEIKHNSVTIRSPLDSVADLDVCQKLHWSGLTGSAAALAISKYSLEQDSITTVLTANAWEAEMMVESLKFYTGGIDNFPVMLFSGWECLPYDTFSPYQEILSQRIRLLSILPNLTRGLLVVAVDTLMQRLPPTDFIESNSFSFETGAELHIGKFRERMAHISYRNVQQVESPGEFVVRVA